MSNSISIKNLIKTFERKGYESLRAVNDISFDVQRGEIFGLLGPNGAGKTTTIKILTTLLQPTSGTVSICGFDVVDRPLDVRKNICVVLQENSVDVYLTVKNNFLTFGKFHGLSRKEIELKIDHLIELFGLRECLNQKPIDLSGGMKRRVQVAKMFLVDKPVMFLDEATTGMDTFNKRATITAIKEEARRGRTIVLTTHMLDEAEELCNSIAIINHGKIIASGPTDDVKSMGLQMFCVKLKFNELTDELQNTFRQFSPTKIEVKDLQIELMVREQQTALHILSYVQSLTSLQSFEITTASLEDVFVELIDRKQKAEII